MYGSEHFTCLLETFPNDVLVPSGSFLLPLHKQSVVTWLARPLQKVLSILQDLIE